MIDAEFPWAHMEGNNDIHEYDRNWEGDLNIDSLGDDREQGNADAVGQLHGTEPRRLGIEVLPKAPKSSAECRIRTEAAGSTDDEVYHWAVEDHGEERGTDDIHQVAEQMIVSAIEPVLGALNTTAYVILDTNPVFLNCVFSLGLF